MVAEQLRTNRKIHGYGTAYTFAVLIAIVAGFKATAIALLAFSLVCSAFAVYKITKLLKSPFLYLSEVEAFVKQSGKAEPNF